LRAIGETAPQIFRRDTLPAGVDLKTRRELPVLQTVPLDSFLPGDYRLEIEVRDNNGAKTAKETIDFTVTETR